MSFKTPSDCDMASFEFEPESPVADDVVVVVLETDTRSPPFKDKLSENMKKEIKQKSHEMMRID